MTVIREFTRTENDPEIPGRTERVCNWARANNLDPKQIAACLGEVILTIEEIDGQQVIRYRQFVRNEAGGVQIQLGAAADDDKVVTVEQIAPLLVPMPDRWDA